MIFTANYRKIKYFQPTKYLNDFTMVGTVVVYCGFIKMYKNNIYFVVFITYRLLNLSPNKLFLYFEAICVIKIFNTSCLIILILIRLGYLFVFIINTEEGRFRYHRYISDVEFKKWNNYVNVVLAIGKRI